MNPRPAVYKTAALPLSYTGLMDDLALRRQHADTNKQPLEKANYRENRGIRRLAAPDSIKNSVDAISNSAVGLMLPTSGP